MTSRRNSLRTSTTSSFTTAPSSKGPRSRGSFSSAEAGSRCRCRRSTTCFAFCGPACPGFQKISRRTSCGTRGTSEFSDAADEVGLNEAEEQLARNYSMGWKKGSRAVRGLLLRRTKKKAAEASLRMQAKSWGKTDK